MPRKLHEHSASFKQEFADFLSMREEDEALVADTVREIITKVRKQGDAAVFEYTNQFDHIDLTADTIRVSEKAINKAKTDCDPKVESALQDAAIRLRDYHEKQIPKDMLYEDATGTKLGWKWSPVDSVGLYVPGGRASYPSSVLHNAIPAKVAGAKRLAMVVPTPNGEVNPAILVAAYIAGVDEIYTIGGAQAIAALAYGTESIAAVDTIVGPGNAYVAEAKRQVFGTVGIDMIAGPSEICVVADGQNNPDWIAADLLSQAEHDPIAQSILITNDQNVADNVCESIDHLLETLDRKEIAKASWENYGAVIVCESLQSAIPLINQIAPEHLELAVSDAEAMAEKISHAGAIFMGRYTPEAIGDYVAGPSHVLPTSRTARFSGGLSVYNFIKKTSLIGCTKDSIQKIGKEASDLAESEGLGAHKLSVDLRLKS